MKKRIKIVIIAIIIAIIGLLSMQYFWNVSMFRAEQNQIKTKSNGLLQESLHLCLQCAIHDRNDKLKSEGLLLAGEVYGGNFEKKTITVCKVHPKPDTIVRRCKTEEEWYAYSNDVHCRYHYTGLNLSLLDSLFKTQLALNGITLPYMLSVRDSSNKVLTKIPLDADFNRFQQALDTIPLGIDNKDFLVARLDGSYYGLFRQMRTIFLVSIGIVALLIFTLIYAGRTIYVQKIINERNISFQRNIAHNLKNQIVYISKALSKIEVSETQQSYVRSMKQKNEWMSLLLDNLLRTSMRNELIDVKPESICLVEHINKIVNQIKTDYEKFNFSFECDDTQPMMACIDETHFRYALINLIENAVKYSNHHPDIFIGCIKKENKIYISVKDDGIGIQPTYKNKIFDPDFRVPECESVPQKGFGLGLCYVKIVAEAHGGEITVESFYKKGSTFTLILPATQN